MKLQGVDDWTPGPMKPYEDLPDRLYKIIEEHNPTVGNLDSSKQQSPNHDFCLSFL